MKTAYKNNSFIKLTVIATAISATLFSGGALAALTEAKSTPTPTMQGYAPYIQSVGSKFVNKNLTESKAPLIGDIIEVPTYLIDDAFYSFRDGNDETQLGSFPPNSYVTGQDFDSDNAINGRDREGQYKGQKVSVKWFIIDKKAPVDGIEYVFADSDPVLMAQTAGKNGDQLAAIFETWEAANPTKKLVKSWDDIDVISEVGESYYIPMSNGSDSSLALRVPPEAGSHRIGFVIVPESRTGDPARGTPLRVPDLNFYWGQKPNTKPGDVCETPQSPADLTGTPSPECEDKDGDGKIDNGGTPEGPNIDNGGGVVGLRQYMVNIRWSEDGSGIPKFLNGQPVDPIVGVHPDAMYPVTNGVYYAEIAILAAGAAVDPNTPATRSLPISNNMYRLLKLDTSDGYNERDSITWELTQHKFVVDGDGVVSIDRTSAEKDETEANKLVINWGENKSSSAFINLSCKEDLLDEANAGTKSVEEVSLTGGTSDNVNGAGGKCNPFADHAFKTQINNPSAQNFWKMVSGPESQGNDLLNGLYPEESEQLMSIQVKFGYDESDNVFTLN